MGNIDPGKPNGNGRWEPGQDKHIQENANTNKCNQSSCAEHNDAAFMGPWGEVARRETGWRESDSWLSMEVDGG